MSDKSSSKRYSRSALILTLISGLVVGVFATGGFIWTMETTNSEGFCLGCHEMKDYVYPGYDGSAHDFNRSGVRTTCSDCHVPTDWLHKIARKIKSSTEVYHALMGTIGTPDKYAAKRQSMADKVLEEMRSNDSRACRNCHDTTAMNTEKQSVMSVEAHLEGVEAEMTCVDCHDGIAHTPPDAR